MTLAQILLAIAVGLAVSEFSEVCPWAARKLVRWSAHRRYAPPSRAELRAEELAAYIDDRPGRLFKLITRTGLRGCGRHDSQDRPWYRTIQPAVVAHQTVHPYLLRRVRVGGQR
jgi:hypothetical protein